MALEKWAFLAFKGFIRIFVRIMDGLGGQRGRQRTDKANKANKAQQKRQMQRAKGPKEVSLYEE